MLEVTIILPTHLSYYNNIWVNQRRKGVRESAHLNKDKYKDKDMHDSEDVQDKKQELKAHEHRHLWVRST